jgi:hypothetical protein
MGAREETIAALEANTQALLHELDGLPEEKLTQVFLGVWSVREILAHIVGWNDIIAQGLERMARGEPMSPPGVDLSDVDGMNARFAEAVRALDVAAVRRNLDAAVARLIAAARALPEDRFAEGKTALRVLRTMAEHPQEHIPQIQEWKRSAAPA